MKAVKTLCLFAAIGLGAGCATTSQDAYTGERKTNKTTTGAVLGGVVGAVGGALVGGKDGRNKRMLVGGLLGAGTGAAIGNYMDQQEAELRRTLQGSGVSVTRNGNQITLNMPGNITFASDSANINASFYSVLNSVGIVLNKFNNSLVEIAGHTDSVGTVQHNQMLSERRSESVRAYLAGRNINPGRLRAIGFGETQPVASNMYAPGRAQNRRVEVHIVGQQARG